MKKPPTSIDPLFFHLLDWKPSRNQQRQIQILEAAIETLASEGIEGASLGAIGNRIQMDRSHIVYYFKTKEDLIRKTIEYIAANAQRMAEGALDAELTPHAKFKAYVLVNFQWAAQFPTHAKVMALFYYLCGHRKHFALMNKSLRDIGRQRLAGILKEIESPNKNTQSLENLAFMIQNLIVGTILYALSTGQEEKLEALGKKVWEKCSAET